VIAAAVDQAQKLPTKVINLVELCKSSNTIAKVITTVADMNRDDPTQRR
jgi:hypothetical protein